MKDGYIPREQRKKILFMCDDIRTSSGIATIAREIVIGTAHRFNWVNLGGAIQHPDMGKRLDLNEDTNKHTGIPDSSVYIFPSNGYGTPEMVRALIKMEKPDAIIIFTDPRYWTWLFQIEHEIRQQIPIIYLNIWDDLPYPMYNRGFYESCDTLMAISKQTENINRSVLKERADDKIIKYVPHGINEDYFFPITSDNPDYLTMDEIRKEIFKGKEYKFVLFYNARNIRRKSVPDIMLAWKFFIDLLPEKEAAQCSLLLHTQPRDENGTDLPAVAEMLYGKDKKYNYVISESRIPTQVLNVLYNISDATILISSNEGWGLSITESMMAGKPIIANVTGGMQDQMRFEDENGDWIKFTEDFGSNHRGKYKKCGEWALPVFPSNISLIGSLPTPYIFDDRVAPEDVSKAIRAMYDIKLKYPEDYKRMCQKAREWVTSDESMMSSRWMCKNVIDTIEETLEKWEPRYRWEIIDIDRDQPLKHYVKHPVPC